MIGLCFFAPGTRSRSGHSASGLVLLAALTLASGQAVGRGLSGRAEVIDGDSLRIDGTEVRLHGMDAPELDQPCIREDGSSWPCGEAARDALAGLIDGRPVRCARAVFHNRFVGDCRVGGERISPWMLRQGWALVDRRGARRYVGYESEARRAGRNLWSGSFEKPWTWREQRRERAGSESVKLLFFDSRTIDQ